MPRAYVNHLLHIYERDYLAQALKLSCYGCLGASLLILCWAYYQVSYISNSGLSLASLQDCLTLAFSYKEQSLGFRLLVVGIGSSGLKLLLQYCGNKSFEF